MWEDLAELRTVAVDPAYRGRKIGHRLVTELLGAARDLGVRRVFVLTFETGFFASFGFMPIDGAPVRRRSSSSCCARTTRGRGVPRP
jgi:amino-acid N-acetyltransferase